MADVYSQTLELRRNLGDSFPVRFAKALADWQRDRWPRDREWFDVDRAETFKALDGSIFRWEPYRSGEGYFLDFTLRHADFAAPDVSWSTRVTLHYAETAHVWIRISNTSEDQGDPRFRTTRPRLVLQLARIGGCFCDGQILNLNPAPLNAQGLRDLAVHSLLAPERKHPVILLTPRSDGTFAEDPDRIVEEFATLGVVKYVAEPSATYALTEELGRRELSCFGGAMRVYLPGFTRDADPFKHPLLLPRSLMDRTSRPLLARNLSLYSTRRYSESPDINALRDERAVSYQLMATVQLEGLRATAARSSDTGDWFALAEAYAAENDTLRHEVRSLREDLKEAERKNRALLFQLNSQTADMVEEGSGDPVGGAASVAEAVELAQEYFGDVLVLLPSAFESAAESIFERPNDVLDALKAMADIAKEAGAGGLGKSLKSACADRGLDYRGGIAPTTPKKLKKRHEFRYEDGQVACEEHICFGTSYDPKECLRIYFSSDRLSGGRFIIGHVGRHLDTKMTT